MVKHCPEAATWKGRNHVGSALTAPIDPTRRGCQPQATAERGRTGWQKRSGYNWRALVQADIARRKPVVGDRLHSQSDGRQATEVAIATNTLNRRLDLGRAEYVRIP